MGLLHVADGKQAYMDVESCGQKSELAPKEYTGTDLPLVPRYGSLHSVPSHQGPQGTTT